MFVNCHDKNTIAILMVMGGGASNGSGLNTPLYLYNICFSKLLILIYFLRFIGNLIISYEFFHKGEHELAQMKILEIGKWLEELDKGTDEFYLSINTGIQHIMEATFIHMLFATNLTEECKWVSYLLFICSYFNRYIKYILFIYLHIMYQE